MEIDKELQQIGITESIINFFHSRSKNYHMKVIKVNKSSSSKSSDVQDIKVNLTVENNNKVKRHLEYTINLAKIRQKRINILLNERKI